MCGCRRRIFLMCLNAIAVRNRKLAGNGRDCLQVRNMRTLPLTVRILRTTIVTVADPWSRYGCA